MAGTVNFIATRNFLGIAVVMKFFPQEAAELKRRLRFRIRLQARG